MESQSGVSDLKSTSIFHVPCRNAKAQRKKLISNTWFSTECRGQKGQSHKCTETGVPQRETQGGDHKVQPRKKEEDQGTKRYNPSQKGVKRTAKDKEKDEVKTQKHMPSEQSAKVAQREQVS